MPTPSARLSLAVAAILLCLCPNLLHGQSLQPSTTGAPAVAIAPPSSPTLPLLATSETASTQDPTPASPTPASAEAPAANGVSLRPIPQQIMIRIPDFNQDIYYKNKLELSFEGGWLPINVPLVWDFLVDSAYTTNPLPYTMVPYILSLRWQKGDIKGPVVLRGNWDFTFSGAYTDVTRGPETRYFAFDYGIRRNFVPRRWRVAPYFEMRGGLGAINAKGYKVTYGQGQDLTFTYMMGSGFRYNFNPRYSITAGLNYYHVSDAYLSEPKLEDYGINVYGPMAGINIRLGGPRHHTTR